MPRSDQTRPSPEQLRTDAMVAELKAANTSTKTAYFVLLQNSRTKANRVVSGPHRTFEDASSAAQEVNSRLSAPPFAHVRRTNNAKQTTAWSQEVCS